MFKIYSKQNFTRKKNETDKLEKLIKTEKQVIN